MATAAALFVVVLALGCAVDSPTPHEGTEVWPPEGGLGSHLGERLPLCRFGNWRDEHFEPDGQLLRCEVVPFLCELPVESWIVETDVDRAFDLVFVGEGFDASEQDLYRGRVDELIDGMLRDEGGIVARAPSRFNFHRVDVISGEEDAPPLPLAGCLDADPLGTGSLFYGSEPVRVQRAAANAPDADVVIVLLDSTQGRANAGIHLGLLEGHRILTHELGHALFGLGDEYSEVDACYAPDGDPLRSTLGGSTAPNLSYDLDHLPWKGLVDGAVEGGRRHERCVWHPTERCRMGTALEGDFCPVCEQHIEALLGVLDDPEWNDGPPTCGIEWSPRFDDSAYWIFGVAADPNGIAQVTVEVDGAEVARCDGDACYATSCPRCRPPRAVEWWKGMAATAFHPGEISLGPHLVTVRCEDRLGGSAVRSHTITIE